MVWAVPACFSQSVWPAVSQTAGRDGKSLLKGAVKGRVVGKAHLDADGLQRLSAQDKGFGGDQAALGHIAVKAYVHFVAEQPGNGSCTYKKMGGRRLQGVC